MTRPGLPHEPDQRLLPCDRALANALPQIIWTCDAHGQLSWVNDRWYELTGLSEAETLTDKGALTPVHPDDRHELWRHWTHALATSTVTEFEYRIRSRTGEYRWYLARVAPVRNVDDDITGWVAAVLDIHDRRLAEDARRASERRFDSFFHLNPIPLAITREADGVFLLVNDAFVALTGYSRDEVVGRSSVELGMVDAETRGAAAACFSVGRGRSYEMPVRRKDGHVVTIMLSNSQLEIDGVSCFLNSGVDVTEQRAIEQALRGSELQARAAEDALRRVNRRKDDFLALLSHELRNPLTPILTSARLLEERVDEEARHDVGIIVRQVKHLSRLVDDLLDVAGMARGAITLKKTRIEPAIVIQRAAQSTAPLFAGRDHQLEIAVSEHGLAVDADEVRLTQIFDNLLSNAARYTPPGGTIRVVGEREGDVVVLRVRDSGRGIEPALLPDVFESFVQGPRGPDRAGGGLGVGLSLVRALTELHGGTVAVQSDGAGWGSEFTIRLPAAKPMAKEVAPATPGGSHTLRERGARVLVVDDHSDVADGLARLLRLVGYDPRVALTPLEAIETAELFRPQIAVLDIGLPIMDGYMLAEELRTRLGDAMPALIALSGYDQARDRRRSQEAGFAMHLAKPVDVDELVDALDGLCS